MPKVFVGLKISNFTLGTLIDAARSGTGSVSRFISRSRSEDSVCNAAPSNNRGSASRSNSPGSEGEGVTASPTDSNPSMDKPDVNASNSGKHKQKDHHSHLYGQLLRLPIKKTSNNFALL